MKLECKYGLLCQRQNSEHWLTFSHPASPTATVRLQADEADGQSYVDSGKKVPLNLDNHLNQIAANSMNGDSKIVLLMLVGLPGSGKSTFCNRLVQSSPSKWRRICQDIISNGKRGTKEQCLKAAEKAFNLGINVMIDRCNLTKDQRHDFVQLAIRLQVQAEALVLDLPVKTCIQRAIQRTGHEGGLEGKSAPAAIQRMAQKKEFPLEVEGFKTIISCHTDEDIQRTFSMYQGGKQGEANMLKLPLSNKADEKSIRSIKYGAEQSDMSNGTGACIDDGSRTLAFPSISTADFQFDHERAAEIIVAMADDILLKFRKHCLRLILVDLKEDSDMLVRVRQKAIVRGLNPAEFMAVAGDITKLRSGCGLHCNFIANATNWRLKPGGGGVNAAIFEAAGKELESETKNRAKTLNPGSALVVPLPPTSPLHVAEGVTHVIHVLGPNMNPRRPNCLQGDYAEGCKVLRDAYSCMFQAFASQVEAQFVRRPGQNCSISGTATTHSDKAKPRDAFTVLMQSSKRKVATAGSDIKVKQSRQDAGREEANMGMKLTTPVTLGGGSALQEHTSLKESDLERLQENKAMCEVEAPIASTSFNSSGFKSKKWEPWAEALRKMALHPEQDRDIMQVTDQAIVIPDKFPKGKKHFLVISRLDGLDSIDELRSLHLTLLQDMHNLGLTLVQSSLQQDKTLVFRMGYHSDPSMRQLHMHVISQDFDSSSLKNKKHWNSFTTTFFRDSKLVMEELRDTGRVKPCGDESSLLKTELRCHRCLSAQPNIPRLKLHIRSCQASFPSDLMQKGLFIMSQGGHLRTDL